MEIVAPQRLPHPVFLTEPPYAEYLRKFTTGDIRATHAQVRRFREFAGVGDPLADAVVAAMRAMPDGQGRVLLERAIEEGIDAVPQAPQEFRAFFAQVDEIPFWLDAEQIELGARTSRRSGILGLYALQGLALMGGYLASRPGKTLVATGNLRSAAPRRLVETASWWLDITEPKALTRFGTGFKNTLRVRILHAQVRAAMVRRPGWDYEAWDHPLNQVQTVGTLTLFSLAFLVGTHELGVRHTTREREAVVHMWRYIGYLQGIVPELVPTTEADTWRLFWLEAVTEFIPDEDSLRLARALADTFGPPEGENPASRLIHWAVSNYTGSYSRLVLGRRNADFLELPDSALFRTAVVATSTAVRSLELVRQLVPGATSISDRVGTATRRWLIDRGVREVRANLGYQTHEHPPV
jgi:hypothetical protein